MSGYATLNNLCQTKNAAPFTGNQQTQPVTTLISEYGGFSYKNPSNACAGSCGVCSCDSRNTFAEAYKYQTNPYGSSMCNRK